MSSQKSDKSNSIRIIFIKVIININIIKININNTYFIIIKYSITRIFIKLEYIFICMQSRKTFFNHFTCDKPIKNKFQCCYRIIKSFITHFLSYIFIRVIYYKEGYKETAQLHISGVLYLSGIYSNIKEPLRTAL